ncbi:Endonuclease-reverse transcriptase [Popillia japonica]|uniref:Endonuclease-reverse transcriptase n=1 Tax=Popillia japonica TaxID=7064 RepID=A0AAW1HU54_POPJA
MQRKSLLEWKPISDRILTVRMKSSVRLITIQCYAPTVRMKSSVRLITIQCYAPTEVSEEEPKDVFYQELSTLQKVKNGDIIILMGDLNAKVGSNNEEYENIMGQHGLGQRNSNGERLIELCMEHDLIIGGTQFPHKDVHKVTWTSPDQQTQNQIDHIAISKKWRGCLNDVRNKRSADVGSDHHLLIGKIKLKLSAVKRKAQFRKRKRYNVVTLHNETNAKRWKDRMNQLSLEKTEMKIHDENNIESLRKTLKQKINQTLSIDEKTRITKEYKKIQKNIKKSARTDKRKWIDGIATAAEEAAVTQNLKELYKSTKLLSSTNFSKNQPIRSKNGELITTTEEQLTRWEQYYSELLQQNPNFSEAESEQHDRDTKYLEIDQDIPTENEIAEAINKLRNGKAPGIDEIPSELWKVHTKASS